MIWATKDGRALAFRFLEQDPDDTCGLNKGYVVRRVEALLDEEPVGHLKISYVASELIPQCYPTVWHLVEVRGPCFDPDDLTDAWNTCHHSRYMPESLRGSGVSILGLRGHEPDEPTMRADLDALADKHFPCLDGLTPNEAFAQLCEKTADYAFVDHIRVPEHLRRQGIGTALYNEGAMWLMRRYGLVLHGSGLQSDEAAATWEAMRTSGLYPVRQTERHDGKIIYQLDYRPN